MILTRINNVYIIHKIILFLLLGKFEGFSVCCLMYTFFKLNYDLDI